MKNLEELDKLLKSDNEKKDKIENRNDEINNLIEHAKNTSGTDDEEKLYTITVSDINKENLVAKKDSRKRIGF